MSRLRNDDGGFTVVELMVTILLLTIVGGVVTTGLVRGHRVTRDGQERVAAITDLQRTMHRVTRDLRAATRFVEAGPEAVEVEVSRGGERLRYRYALVGTNLTERVSVVAANGTVTVRSTNAQWVTDAASGGPTFRYRFFDEQGTELATGSLTQIGAVEVNVVRTLPNQPAVSVQSSVFVRNFSP
jgi:Tfp pilus assembly protein PilE